MTKKAELDQLSSEVAALKTDQEAREHKKCSTKLKCHLACILLGLAISLLLAYVQTNIYVLTGFPWLPNVIIEAIDRIKHIT